MELVNITFENNNLNINFNEKAATLYEGEFPFMCERGLAIAISLLANSLPKEAATELLQDALFTIDSIYENSEKDIVN